MAKNHNNKQLIERKVEETMKWLDGYQAEPSNPFFYTRLKQRMDNERTGKRKISLAPKPAFAYAFALLALLLNIWMLGNYSTSSTASGGYERNDYIAAFANDYEIDNSSGETLFWYEDETYIPN